MPVETTNARRPVLAGAAVAATAILAVLHDVPLMHGLARHLLYLMFGAMAVVSFIRLFGAVPSPSFKTQGSSHLPLMIPALAVAIYALIAIWGGFGLNNNLSIRSHSVYLHEGGLWQGVRSMQTKELWKFFSPRVYYTIEDFGNGYFRPMQMLFLWIGSYSIVTTSVFALLIHAFNAVGLGVLACRWRADAWIAAASGTLFAVHPLMWHSMGNTDDLHYAQGTAFLLASLLCYDQSIRRRGTVLLMTSVILFGLSCLFAESFLGASVFFLVLTGVFLRTGRLTRHQAVRTLVVFGLATLLIAGILLSVELAAEPVNRLGMLQVTLKRVALTTFFEPQFGFFHPLEPGRITPALQLFAVPLAVLAGLVFSSMWGPYSSVAWLASGFMLGPALAFFEVTSGGWSSGRLAYGPAFLLCLSLAMVSPSTHRALVLVRWVLFSSALAACLITFGRIVVA